MKRKAVEDADDDKNMPLRKKPNVWHHYLKKYGDTKGIYDNYITQ